MDQFDTHGLETVDVGFEDLPEDIGAMSIMGSQGDLKVTWNPKDEKDIKSASELFSDLRSKKYLAFRLKGRKGEQGEQITEFDPKAGRVIFVPQFKGG